MFKNNTSTCRVNLNDLEKRIPESSENILRYIIKAYELIMNLYWHKDFFFLIINR